MGKNQSLIYPSNLILASTSSYRTQLLKQLGLEFTNQNPQINEDDFKLQDLKPEKLALILSQEKSRSVFKNNPQSTIIGSDQVCSMDLKLFSKPGSREKAIEQLLLLQGKKHELITAVTICSPLKEISFVNQTFLKMRPLSLASIERYVDQDLPFDCAGSYKLESHGIKLFESINMTDHTSIIGLPLIQLTTALIELGFVF